VPIQRAAPAPRTIADPAGYLVVHADAARRLLVIEHYMKPRNSVMSN
jgi:hypothetical protein